MVSMNEMLQSHPQKPTRHLDAIAQCVAATYECAQVNIACADACLAEERVAELRDCIRLNLDCADICAATGRMAARQASPQPEMWRSVLQACIQACRSTAAECAKHESQHEHCRYCKEACERCIEACQRVLDAYPEGGAEATH